MIILSSPSYTYTTFYIFVIFLNVIISIEQKVDYSSQTWIYYPPISPLNPINAVYSYLNASVPIEFSATSANESFNPCFFTLGDWGTNDEHQLSVAIQMSEAALKIKPQFIISLGDNFYDDGVSSVDDHQWTTTFEDYYSSASLKDVPFFSILGNHDYHINPYAQIAYHFDPNNFNNRWFMPNYWYFQVVKFKNAPVSLPKNPFENINSITEFSDPLEGYDGEFSDITSIFIYLDTQLLTLSERLDKKIPFNLNDQEIFNLQISQLEEILASATGRVDWIFVSGHYNLFGYTKEKDRTILKETLIPLFSKYNVDAYFNGHEHYLAAYKLNHTIYINNGAGGRDIRKGNCIRSECLYFRSEHGFTIQYLTKSKMYTGFFTNDGSMDFTFVHVALNYLGYNLKLRLNLGDLPLIQRIYVGPNPYNSNPHLVLWIWFCYGLVTGIIIIVFIALIYLFTKTSIKKLKSRHQRLSSNDRFSSITYRVA